MKQYAPGKEPQYNREEEKLTPADIEVATLTPSVVYNEELCAKLGIEVPAN